MAFPLFSVENVTALAYLNHNNFIATACKYGFDNYMVNVKDAVWRKFAKISSVSMCMCILRLCVFICWMCVTFPFYFSIYKFLEFFVRIHWHPTAR